MAEKRKSIVAGSCFNSPAGCFTWNDGYPGSTWNKMLRTETRIQDAAADSKRHRLDALPQNLALHRPSDPHIRVDRKVSAGGQGAGASSRIFETHARRRCPQRSIELGEASQAPGSRALRRSQTKVDSIQGRPPNLERARQHGLPHRLVECRSATDDSQIEIDRPLKWRWRLDRILPGGRLAQVINYGLDIDVGGTQASGDGPLDITGRVQHAGHDPIEACQRITRDLDQLPIDTAVGADFVPAHFRPEWHRPAFGVEAEIDDRAAIGRTRWTQRQAHRSVGVELTDKQRAKASIVTAADHRLIPIRKQVRAGDAHRFEPDRRNLRGARVGTARKSESNRPRLLHREAERRNRRLAPNPLSAPQRRP